LQALEAANVAGKSFSRKEDVRGELGTRSNDGVGFCAAKALIPRKRNRRTRKKRKEKEIRERWSVERR